MILFDKKWAYKDTILPVKKDAIIVPKPTELQLCKRIREINTEEIVKRISEMTFNFPKVIFNL